MKAILVIAGCGLALAQAPPRTSGVVDTNIAGVANLPTQPLAARDLIAVSVYDSPELTRSVRLASDGAIKLPMLKSPIEADGLLPEELETAIAQALKKEQILVDPIVTVTVLEYGSRPVSVAGAVKKPLQFQAMGRVTVLDALVKAEGVTSDAGPDLLLIRTQLTADTSPGVQRIPIKALLDSSDPSLNVLLTGGEEIRVPEARKVYVVGNVAKPGAFPVRDGADTTVLRVLALAEGLTPYASKRAWILRSTPGADARKEVPIELEQILQRKTADVQLQADDVLYIPDNKARRRTAAVFDRLTGFGTATASGVLIWRR